MGNPDQLLPGQRQRRKSLAGYHYQWIQSIEKRRFLPEFIVEFYGFRHHLLVFDFFRANESRFAWDEFVQFFGVIVPGKQGECVFGEVFAGLI